MKNVIFTLIFSAAMPSVTPAIAQKEIAHGEQYPKLKADSGP
ncbi:MAG TPA: hypothetical protein VFX55_06705 [Duganella sp.]|nr:hypothetical protein [Duganella sp.]